MSSERLDQVEKNISKIQESIQSLNVFTAVQSEQIVAIKDTLSLINTNMASMGSNMSRMEQTLGMMQTTLAVNTKSLEDHMRRTENLEKRIEPLEKMYWKLLGAGAFGATIVALVFKFLK